MPKSLKFEVSIWYREDDESIRIQGQGENLEFISTVNNKQGSDRYHKHLFNKLKNMLEAHNCVD